MLLVRCVANDDTHAFVVSWRRSVGLVSPHYAEKVRTFSLEDLLFNGPTRVFMVTKMP